MNGSELQRLIALGLADLMTAQHLTVPTLECFTPGMIGPERRAELRKACTALMYAAMVAKNAAGYLEDASKMIIRDEE